MPRPTAKPSPTRTIALCYLRKSIVRNGTDYAAVEIQRAAVTAECEWRGWACEWYEDADGHRSGRHEQHRPAWLSLKRRITSPDVVAVVGYRLDRIARSVKDLAGLMELCAKQGVGIVTADKQVDTTGKMNAWSEAHIGIMAVFAQLESDMARDRMKDRVASKDAAGINHGKPPYGMKRVGEGNAARFVATGDIGAVVRCLELYSSGMSYDETAERLNRDVVQFRSRAGALTGWGREAVRTVVGNVLRYSGYHMPQVGYDAKNNRVEYEGEGDACDKWARKLGAWESPAVDTVIDRQLANAVIDRRYRNQRAGRHANAQPFLLTPIAYWSGRKLHGQARDYGKRFYRTRGSGISIDADIAERGAIDRLSGITFPPELRFGIQQALLAKCSTTHQAALQREVTECKRAQGTLVDLLLANSIERSAYDSRYAQLQKRIMIASNELAMPTEVEQAMRKLTEIGAMLSVSTPDKQRRAIQLIFDRIELSADGEIVAAQWAQWARYLFEELKSIRNNDAEGGSSGQHCYLPARVDWCVQLPVPA